MAEVYRARDARLERAVVLNVLPRETAAHASVEGFQREARAASALNHPIPSERQARAELHRAHGRCAANLTEERRQDVRVWTAVVHAVERVEHVDANL